MGAGVWSDGSRKEESYTLKPDVSISQAEVFDIFNCARLVAKEECYREHIYICGEIYAALTTLKQITSCSKLVGDKQLLLLRVPNRCGIRGNIEADKLVRVGASGGGHKNPESIGTLLELVKKVTNRWINSEFVRHGQEALGMLHTRALIRECAPQISGTPIGLDRKVMTAYD